MGTKPMTNEELDAIEAREKAATAGPWVVWSDEGPVWLPNRKALPRECLGGWTMSVCHHDGSFESSDHRCVATAVMRSEDDAQGGSDAAFIAAARTDVPALIAEVRSHRSEILCLDASVMDLRAERDALRAEVERLRAVTDAAKSLAAQIKHAEHCPGNRHLDCGPAENEAWCCVWCRSQEECLRRKADCDCHIAAWRELLGVPVAREDGR